MHPVRHTVHLSRSPFAITATADTRIAMNALGLDWIRPSRSNGSGAPAWNGVWLARVSRRRSHTMFRLGGPKPKGAVSLNGVELSASVSAMVRQQHDRGAPRGESGSRCESDTGPLR